MIRCLNLGFNYYFLNMLSRSSMVYALDSGAGNWGSITYKVAVPNVDVLSDSCYRFLQKVLLSGYRKMLTYYDSHAKHLANFEVKNASIGKPVKESPGLAGIAYKRLKLWLM